MSENGWDEYQRLVMDSLKRLEKAQACTTKEVGLLRTGLAVQKVKSGMWGAISGALAAIAAILTESFVRKH